jgi:hypothetical protein
MVASRTNNGITIPGPDRRRTPKSYAFRLTYRSRDVESAGCLATWEVTGGREGYQVALERDAGGWLHWHCTCADAVYRSEGRGRACKHVLGLSALGPRTLDAESLAA